MHQFIASDLDADALKDMSVAAPDVHLFDLETFCRAVHGCRSLAKSKS